MQNRVFYLRGSSVTTLIERVPPIYWWLPLDEGPVTAPKSVASGVLLIDGTPDQLERAVRLKGTHRGLLVVVVADTEDAPDVPSPEVYAYVPLNAPRASLLKTLATAFAHLDLRQAYERTQTDLARLASELRDLNTIGINLSAERNTDALLELILSLAREITCSDAGSLYLVESDEAGHRRLRFQLVQNDSWSAPFKEDTIPISSRSVAGHAALTGEMLELADAYVTPFGSPFQIDRTFDEQTGYRTKSMLVVPMKTPRDEVIGVLQLINCKVDRGRRFTSRAEIEREALPFSPRSRELASSLASQAAVAIENARLYADLHAALRTVENSQKQIIQGERLRALGEMAGGVAHDFNNVLAVVVGRAQLLLRQTEDPDVRRQLEVIEGVGQDGAQAVRRVQEFARTRRTRPFERVDLSQVVCDVVGITRIRWHDEAQARGVIHDVRVETTPVPPVIGDAAELRESVMSLLLNALDAMPGGGQVVLATGVERDRVYCAVSDTGSGMTEEVRQRIFEPYFTTKDEQGTGLGLSIAYGIVTRHGGEIDVQSRPGGGSTFTIRLPIGRDSARTEPSPPLSRVDRRGRILVIDDEPAVRDILVDLLSRQGHDVVACADGRAGIARLDGDPFDLVMVDLSMPGLSGWEVVRVVRQKSPATQVSLITGWGDQIDRDEVRQKGAEFLVAKPFNLDEILAVVDEALARRERELGGAREIPGPTVW